MRRNNTVKYVPRNDVKRINPCLQFGPGSHSPQQSSADIRDAVFGFVRSLNTRFHRFLTISYDDYMHSITIKPDSRYSDNQQTGVIVLESDRVNFTVYKTGHLWSHASYSVVYADPEMFNEIEKFISRIYNG